MSDVHGEDVTGANGENVRPDDVGEVVEVERWGHYDGALAGIAQANGQAYYYELAPWSDVVSDAPRDYLLYEFPLLNRDDLGEPAGRFTERAMTPAPRIGSKGPSQFGRQLQDGSG